MKGRSRGRVLIITNIKFHPNTGNKKRPDSSLHDAKQLKEALTVLGYKECDITVYINLTADDMIHSIQKGNYYFVVWG